MNDRSSLIPVDQVELLKEAVRGNIAHQLQLASEEDEKVTRHTLRLIRLLNTLADLERDIATEQGKLLAAMSSARMHRQAAFDAQERLGATEVIL